mmetsp:Transcript_70171/g.159298  ORF Transcript_70171/g.159298 Transcript_70171/m.159298 type:complete len:285 (-) Transcript_70171:693-1547(-)
MPIVVAQDEGKSSPGSSITNLRLRKCSVLCCLTVTSAATSWRRARRQWELLSGGTNWSPSSRLSERLGLKISVSSFRSSSLKAPSSLSRLFQKAPPMATVASRFSSSFAQPPSSVCTRVASERLNLSRPRSTPCRLGACQAPGLCTRVGRVTRRDCTIAVSGWAAIGSAARTALGRTALTRLTALTTAERGRLDRTRVGSTSGTNSRGRLSGTTALTAADTADGTLAATGALTLATRFGRLMRNLSMPKLTAPGLLTIMPLAPGGARRPGRLSWNLSTPNSTPP